MILELKELDQAGIIKNFRIINDELHFELGDDVRKDNVLNLISNYVFERYGIILEG